MTAFSLRSGSFSIALLLCAASAVSVVAQSAPSQVQSPPVVLASKQWTGDLDTLLKHRVIRVGVFYSKTFFYTVKGVNYGISYEAGKEFEKYLNAKYPNPRKNIRTHIVFYVTPKDKAASQLNDGYLDVLMGAITITPEREKLVDFSIPSATGINQVVVTAPNVPRLASVDDLSGKEVFVRKASAFWEDLERLNERFKTENKAPVKLTAVPEDLGEEDILEMVNAGLLPMTVVPDWAAKLWSRVLTKMQVYSNIAVASGQSYGWAVRKGSPQLLAAINEFAKTHGQGTAFSKQLVAKYTSQYMLKQAVSPASMQRFEQTAQLFHKYSDRYSVDYLLMMAEGYQESGLNQHVHSSVGAIGVMQLMPKTGEEMRVGDIHQEEANIHAGVKYFTTMMKKLYGDEPMDDVNKILFTFAAYNCGPNRVKQLRAEAAQKGLDPNVWLNNVEFIVAERVGQETVDYVSNIYKYYVAYKLLSQDEERRKKAKESLKQKPS